MEEYSAWIILVLGKLLPVLKSTVVLYVAIPLIIKFLPQVVAQGAFLNLVCPPLRFLKLSQPERWGLTNVINQYITGPDNLKLGLWHIRPEYDRHLQDAAKVFIYCHGNAGHRGFGHRNLIFKVFQSLGFHVIAFDYRGFGDSEGWPTQHGVIQDTVAVYEWVVQHTTSDCKIFLWGHSLGTSIATHAVAQVQENTSNPPRGLILESPFTSLND
uniref:AB hydrolase-1 domain-containing protein n=1 Tax=Ciona savignyi TaxID=51511 RepID=H2ZL85_CIOSA